MDDIIEKKEKYALSIWNLEGAKRKLLNYLEQWIFADKNITKNGFLIYLNCLLEKGDTENALVGLRKYYHENGEEYISDFLPLAKLAWDHQIGGEEIRKAAFIFKKLEKFKRKKTLAKYLEGKDFVIVGNSPSIIGKNQGEKIDSKKIVFRMNTYKISEEFICDTGSKITAFVNNSNFATINHINHFMSKKVELIYIPYDFWHIKISQFCNTKLFIDSYFNILEESDVLITYFHSEDSISLKKKLKIISPSSGMAIFWSIYRIFGYIQPEWFIGFSEAPENNGIYENPLKDKGDLSNEDLLKANLDSFSERDELTTFYKDAPIYSAGHGHNFNRELTLRNKIIRKGINN